MAKESGELLSDIRLSGWQAGLAPCNTHSSTSWPDLLSSIIDELDYGLAIIKRDRQVVKANRMARYFWAQKDSQHLLVNNTLVASDEHGAARLCEAMHAAERGRRSLIRLGVHRIGSTFALIPVATPAEELALHDECACRTSRLVLLVYGKHHACDRLSIDNYARVHGLTHAETEVLAAVCDGESPNGIADHFGVGISTIRSQIASIRAKTETATIRELALQVAMLPPVASLVSHQTSGELPSGFRRLVE